MAPSRHTAVGVAGSTCLVTQEPSPRPRHALILVTARPGQRGHQAGADRPGRAYPAITATGYDAHQPYNPYWTRNGAVTVKDPDHWRAAAMPQPLA